MAKNDLNSMIDTTGINLPAVTDDLAPVSGRAYTTDVSFENDELMVPRLRIAQGLTQEVQDAVARVGQLVLAGEMAVDEAILVPVAFARAREYRLNDADQTLSCASADAMTGTGDPGGPCKQCPMAQWIPVAGQKNNAPPPCTMIYSYVCWSVTHQSVCSVEFRRSGSNAAKMINTFLGSKGFGNCGFKLTATPQKGPRGNYYIPSVALVKVDEDQLETARVAYSL